MFSHFTSTQLIVVAVAILFVVVIAVATYLEKRKARTKALRSRFGSEYDRAILQHGSSQKAEAKLAGRETRVEALKIRELGANERERFVAEWQTVQSRFVDHPKAAVTEADDLIAALLVARGYPRDTFEQSAADLSVTYPRVMEGYRVAHAIAVRPSGAEAGTEELRTAMIQYRAMFDELVQAQKPLETRTAA
ncbi:MAG: hypothetical protein ABSE53_06095 [Terracidiphilus sp.]|jgi:hypothetical protein